MADFINLTAVQLPLNIGRPIAEEMRPAIDGIDARHDLSAFHDRTNSGLSPGTHTVRAYDSLRDVPPEYRTLGQLEDSGGGPLHSGWLHKEARPLLSVRSWCAALGCRGTDRIDGTGTSAEEL